MKSLVALLDRKKRSNTLVPAPLPFPAPTTQVRAYRPSTGRYAPTLDPPGLPAPRLATSNLDLPRYPHLHEPSTPPQRQSPVQSITYHDDSDDDTLADPFAASPSTKATPKLPAIRLRPPPPSYMSARQGSTRNLHAPVSDTAFENKVPTRNATDANLGTTPHTATQTSPGTGVDGNETSTAPVHDIAGKERRLRERRSFSSIFRSQASNSINVPTVPVPQVPPLPSRTPERKTSFFKRGRSGSTPVASQRAEQAHTLRSESATPTTAQSRPQPTVTLQSRCPNLEAAPKTPKAAISSSDPSPDDWVRVQGVNHDQSPISPANTRRRALSVPTTRPPKSAQPPLPILPAHLAPTTKPTKCTALSAPPKVTSRKPSPNDRPARSRYSTHEPKSASVSVTSSHNAGCGSVESNLIRRPTLRDFGHQSKSVSEGGHGTDSDPSNGRVIRKSALKCPPAQTRQQTQTHCSASLTNTPRPNPGLPTPTLELKRLDTINIGHRRAHAPSSPAASSMSTTSPRTPSSLGSANSTAGQSLASSDSRTLPILDNIWGSFKSETAFGSLPSSPQDPVVDSPRSFISRRLGDSPGSPEHPRRQLLLDFKLGPPSSPPVLELPPLPTDRSPALALPLGSVARRKLSRSPSKLGMLLTPPVSPTDETEQIQGLGVVLSTSTADGAQLISPGNGARVLSRGLAPVLNRSASSPVLRSPPNPIQGTGPDTSSRSWFSVDLPRSSPFPVCQSNSQSGSQYTLVPERLICSQPAILNQSSSYPGISSGISTRLFGKGSHVGTLDRPTQVDNLSCGLSDLSMRTGDSRLCLSGLPDVPFGVSESCIRHRPTCGLEHNGNRPSSKNEDPLPTPPVTPACLALVFDEDGQRWDGVKKTGDEVQPSQLGGLGRQRKYVQSTPSNSSNEASSEGTIKPNTPSDSPQ